MQFANEWEVPHWEQFFTSYQSKSHELMLDCANPTVTEDQFHARLGKYVSELKEMKHHLAQKRAEWDDLWKEVRQAGGMLVGHTPTPSVIESLEGQ